MFSGGGVVLWATYLLTYYFSCVFKVLCFFKHQSLHPRLYSVSLSLYLFSALTPAKLCQSGGCRDVKLEWNDFRRKGQWWDVSVIISVFIVLVKFQFCLCNVAVGKVWNIRKLKKYEAEYQGIRLWKIILLIPISTSHHLFLSCLHIGSQRAMVKVYTTFSLCC